MKSFVVLDTETTGIKIESNEVLQVSIVDEEGNVLFNQLIKPAKRKRWDAATETNGITPEMVKDSLSLLDYAQEIEEILKSADLVVGYNIEFDLKHLFNGGLDVGKIPYFCVMEQFAPIYGQYNEAFGNYTWKSLAICAKYFNYGKFRSHDSLEDARATLYCYKKLLPLLESRKRNNLRTHRRAQAEITRKNHQRWLIALILSITLGFFGVDRFYLGKKRTAIIKFLTLGGYGIWWIIDIILIALGKTSDAKGRAVKP